MKKYLSLILITVLMMVAAAGCGSSDSDTSDSGTKDKIVIGTTSNAVDLVNSGIESLEEMGYEVEVVTFDDYNLPNEALTEGSVDVNFYQHTPFLDVYNESNGTDIQMMQPTLWNYWEGLYSTKADSLEDLPDGGMVGISDDASNMDVALRRIASTGLITIDEDKDLVGIADIIDNPHNYEFVGTDGALRWKNMDDYTFLTGTSNSMVDVGVDPTQHLLEKFSDESYALGICIMPENAETQWAKDIMTAYTSDKAKAAVQPSSGFEPVF